MAGIGRRPRPRSLLGARYLTLAIYIYFLGRLVYQIATVGYSSSLADEMFVVAMMPFAASGLGGLRLSRIGRWWIGTTIAYLAVVVLSTFISGYSFERGHFPVLLGLLLEIKPIIMVSATFALVRRQSKVDECAPLIDAVGRCLILVALLNSVPAIIDVIRGSPYALMDGTRLIHRGFLYQPHGFLHHQVPSAQATLLGFLAALVMPRVLPRTLRLSTAVYLFAILLLHQSVKEIVAGFISIGLYFLIIKRQGSAGAFMPVIFGILAVFGLLVASPVTDVVTGRIGFYLGDQGSDSVRRLLYAGSVKASARFFPIGSGVSTFGSQGSRTNGYSSLYDEYGIYGTYGASASNDTQLLDTFWPKVLAESGYLGTLLFIASTLIPVWAAFRGPATRREGFFLFLVQLCVLVASLAAPALTDEQLNVIFYVASGLALARFVGMQSRGPAQARPAATARALPLTRDSAYGRKSSLSAGYSGLRSGG